jgi:hypothetical protein
MGLHHGSAWPLLTKLLIEILEFLGVLGALVVRFLCPDLSLKTDRRMAKVVAGNRISYNATVRTVFGFIVHTEECDGEA